MFRCKVGGLHNHVDEDFISGGFDVATLGHQSLMFRTKIVCSCSRV